jgi:hypothetical protein
MSNQGDWSSDVCSSDLYFNDLSALPFEDGLHLSFGHGTYENNFPVSYGATAFYYHVIP